MNLDRLRLLTSHLSRLPEQRFDMTITSGRDGEEDYHMLGIELSDDCGTAGCIAGWACALFAPHLIPRTGLAADLLGLSEAQAQSLFFPPNLGRYRPLHAVAALQSLQQTGTPQWTI